MTLNSTTSDMDLFETGKVDFTSPRQYTMTR